MSIFFSFYLSLTIALGFYEKRREFIRKMIFGIYFIDFRMERKETKF